MGPPSEQYIVRHNYADESLFRFEELNWALKVSQKNEQPGSDMLRQHPNGVAEMAQR